MSLVRLIARPMLASSFIANGVSRARRPQSASIAPLTRLLDEKFDVQVSPDLVARGAGVAQIAAGSLLAIGKMPRLSAGLLVSTYLIDVVAEQLDGESEKKTSLVTKTSLLGGALLAAVDTAGRPSLAWRARHAAESAWDSIEKQSAKAMDTLTPNS